SALERGCGCAAHCDGDEPWRGLTFRKFSRDLALTPCSQGIVHWPMCVFDSPEFVEVGQIDSKRCYELAHQLERTPCDLAAGGGGLVSSVLVSSVRSEEHTSELQSLTNL